MTLTKHNNLIKTNQHLLKIIVQQDLFINKVVQFLKPYNEMFENEIDKPLLEEMAKILHEIGNLKLQFNEGKVLGDSNDKKIEI